MVKYQGDWLEMSEEDDEQTLRELKASNPDLPKDFKRWSRWGRIAQIRCVGDGKPSSYEEINPMKASSIHVWHIAPKYKCLFQMKSGGAFEVKDIEAMTLEHGETSLYEPDVKGMNVGLTIQPKEGEELVCARDNLYDPSQIMCRSVKSKGR
jgi:hypothetical protein